MGDYIRINVQLIDAEAGARCRDPHIWGTYLQFGWRRLALGLKEDFDGAATVLVDLLEIKPEINSLAQFRAYRPWGNSEYWALFEKTAAAGLHQLGLPND